jgi:hypothetical protein
MISAGPVDLAAPARDDVPEPRIAPDHLIIDGTRTRTEQR